MDGIPPRQIAAELVSAFMEGKDHEPILARECREGHRELAKALARATLSMLRDHARIARQRPA